MTYREADGGDKAAAFARGMSDEEAHVAFETPGVHSVVVNETYLVTYQAYGPACVIELYRRWLYAGPGTLGEVREFLQSEARAFDLRHVCSVIAPPGAPE